MSIVLGLAAGRELARRTGSELRCAVLGQNVGKVAEELAAAGVPVHLLDAPALAHPVAAAQAPALAELVKRLGASHLGAAATAYARDLLPRVAARLAAGMASE